MSKSNSETIKLSYPLAGKIPFNMTNDLLFHYLLQDTEDSDILKGLISAFYEIPIESIKSVTVENPISYGEEFESKVMVLDIRALLNDDTIINLEMQVNNKHDWPERSLSYLCRCFDNLQSGQGYSHVKGAYHIGFLDFTLFPEEPEFYSTYTIRNTKTNSLYSSKFGITVVNLKQIDKATDEDINNHRNLWASFFKATRWEEIHMLAIKDKFIHMAAVKLYKLGMDKKIRDEIWAREDYLRQEVDFKEHYENEIAKRDKEIASQKEEIASKEAEIAGLAVEIERLRKLVGE